MADLTDLVSLVLTLRPMPRAGDLAEAPMWWGRASQALALEAIGLADGGLAAALHEGDGPRPFTTSSLLGRFPARGLDPAGVYTLRMTALRRDVAGALAAAAAANGPLGPGAEVELDRRAFCVESVARSPAVHPWAAATSYTDLAASYLVTAAPPDRQVTLQFTSPTAFKSQERHVPLPLPDLVFGSLIERWNAFAPLAFPVEVKRYAAECLAISRFDLTSRPAPGKEGGVRVGGVGQITYTTLNYDRYWMSVIHTLAAFALFSGVGIQTAAGMGQCRRVDDEGRRTNDDGRRTKDERRLTTDN